MTYKELLERTPFEEIEPYLVETYGVEDMLCYRLHYDMLRSLTPKVDPRANASDCVIDMKSDDGGEPYLSAFPMEGDVWEHSLTKELKPTPSVVATWQEIAACCLWHTSFYGFIPRHVDEVGEFFRFARLSDSEKAKMYARQIKKKGGNVPTLRQLNPTGKKQFIQREKEVMRERPYKENRSKRKRAFRQLFTSCYYRRIVAISRFILATEPAWKDPRNTLSVAQLCGLYDSPWFREEELPSYVRDDMGVSAAKYLENLIRKYPLYGRDKFNRIVIHLITGARSDDLTDDQRALINYIINGEAGEKPFESSDLLLSTDPAQGKQITLRLAFFHSTNPLHP